MVLSFVECIDHPGTLCDHSAFAGHEQGICAGLCDNTLRGADREELADHFHACLALVRTNGCALVIFGDQLCAVIIDQVVPAVLVVGGIHSHAVDIAVGSFCDLLGSFIHVIPCPLVCGIINAVLIKDSLVVQKCDGVMILGDREVLAVSSGVQIDDTLIVLAQIHGLVLFDIGIEIKQDVVLHVHLCCVGMHPEHIGHCAAGSACLEQCPVVIPVDNFDLGGNA